MSTLDFFQSILSLINHKKIYLQALNIARQQYFTSKNHKSYFLSSKAVLRLFQESELETNVRHCTMTADSSTAPASAAWSPGQIWDIHLTLTQPGHKYWTSQNPIICFITLLELLQYHFQGRLWMQLQIQSVLISYKSNEWDLAKIVSFPLP